MKRTGEEKTADKEWSQQNFGSWRATDEMTVKLAKLEKLKPKVDGDRFSFNLKFTGYLWGTVWRES